MAHEFVLQNETQRQKQKYRRKAIECLGQLSLLFPAVDIFPQARNAMTNLFELAPSTNDAKLDGIAMEIDSTLSALPHERRGEKREKKHEEKEQMDPQSLAAAFECI